ncbi:unnamed protein product, partial [Ilex paraguariensis]
VVFVPNYNVSVAEILIPGSELSQHISTAGMEASGTSNMKFALNGCLIIGTLDGANVEIREEIGEENFFLFGATADEVPHLRKERENGLFMPDPRFEEAKQFIRSGAFGNYDYNPLLESLEGNSGYGRGDYFLVGHDFPTYMDAQARVDEAYKDRKRWIKMSILSTSGSGKFSSDRTISQYAKEIWNIEECCVPQLRYPTVTPLLRCLRRRNSHSLSPRPSRTSRRSVSRSSSCKRGCSREVDLRLGDGVPHAQLGVALGVLHHKHDAFRRTTPISLPESIPLLGSSLVQISTSLSFRPLELRPATSFLPDKKRDRLA